MTVVLDNVRSRGYWKVVIRPEDFKQDRIASLEQALDIVKKCAVAVQNRGWTFPKVFRADDEVLTGTDWVGQDLDWHIHVELWRLYLSGQFVYLGGIWDDWLDKSIFSTPNPNWKPGLRLFVGDVIYRFMEVFEFAARLTLTDAGANRMHIEVVISGLKDRVLLLGMPNRQSLDERKLLSDSASYKQSFEREALISQANELALNAASEIFATYQWHPSLDFLKTIQKETIGG